MKPVAKPFASPDRLLAGATFADSYAITAEGLGLDAVEATKRAMGRTPRWVSGLMALRSVLVTPFLLKTGREKSVRSSTRIGFFPFISQSADEVVLGMNDRHLDFRVSVEVKSLDGGRQEVSASTAVKPHNRLGRIYLAIVTPLHRVIVPAMLAQVLKA